MFKEGETVCVSPNKFGYHSVTIDNAISDKVKLLSTDFRNGKELEKCLIEVDGSDIQLVALNPIKGWRDDASCTAFRNFLVELDSGPLTDQMAYVRQREMPYSACVFSGGKSLHFLISLEQDLDSIKTYRMVAQWVLNVMTMADQNTKNPSRSIRVPGATRDDKKQLLVELKGKIKNEALYDWLNKFPEAKPVERPPRARNNLDKFPRLKPWMVKALELGLDPTKGRNAQWFAIACEFALNGWSEDDTIYALEPYFHEDSDFKTKEWEATIYSAFKYIYERK